MKNLFLVLIVGAALTACAGVQGKISADECGCPQSDKKTVIVTEQKGISADECGCPDNDRETKVFKDPAVSGD